MMCQEYSRHRQSQNQKMDELFSPLRRRWWDLAYKEEVLCRSLSLYLYLSLSLSQSLPLSLSVAFSVSSVS